MPTIRDLSAAVEAKLARDLGLVHRKLADVWMVEETDPGVWRSTGVRPELDALASLLGTRGRGANRKALYDRQRQEYLDRQAADRRRKMRSIDGSRQDLSAARSKPTSSRRTG